MEKYLQCPIVIPVVMLLISVYLVVAPIVDNPQIEYLYSIIFMLAGRLCQRYFENSRNKNRLLFC